VVFVLKRNLLARNIFAYLALPLRHLLLKMRSFSGRRPAKDGKTRQYPGSQLSKRQQASYFEKLA